MQTAKQTYPQTLNPGWQHSHHHQSQGLKKFICLTTILGSLAVNAISSGDACPPTSKTNASITWLPTNKHTLPIHTVQKQGLFLLLPLLLLLLLLFLLLFLLFTHVSVVVGVAFHIPPAHKCTVHLTYFQCASQRQRPCYFLHKLTLCVGIPRNWFSPKYVFISQW